jgi:hypothetical protein
MPEKARKDSGIAKYPWKEQARRERNDLANARRRWSGADENADRKLIV